MTDQDLIHQLRNSKGWPTLGNAAADRIEALEAENGVLRTEKHADAEAIAALEARADALAEKLEWAVRGLKSISKATHVDAWGNEKPSYEATIASAALAALEDKK